MDYVTNKDILRMPTKVFCNKLRCFEQLEELYNKQLFNRVMIQLKQFCSNISPPPLERQTEDWTPTNITMRTKAREERMKRKMALKKIFLLGKS